jgi:hypothetical protein
MSTVPFNSGMGHLHQARAGLAWYAAITFYALPFADAMTGFMVLSGRWPEGSAGSLSQMLRGMLLLPGLLMIPRKYVPAAVLSILYFLSLELAMLVLHQQPGWFVVSTVYDFKLIYLLVAYCVLTAVGQNTRQRLSSYFVHGATIYATILLLSTAAGIHTPTYDEGNFGSKGVFASGNALSMYLGCASLLALQSYWENRKRSSQLEALLLVIACLIVGTKASLIFTILFLVLVFQNASVTVQLAIVGLALLAGTVYASLLIDAFSLVFDVILFRFQSSDSLFAFIASGRDVYIADALGDFHYDGWAMVRLLFGTGPFVSFRSASGLLTEYDTLESDFFDLFFSYGTVGIGCYLAIIIYGLRLAWRASHPPLTLAWCGVCFYSAIAGHVLFNAMSGMAIPVLLITMQQAAARRKNHG